MWRIQDVSSSSPWLGFVSWTHTWIIWEEGLLPVNWEDASVRLACRQVRRKQILIHDWWERAQFTGGGGATPGQVVLRGIRKHWAGPAELASEQHFCNLCFSSSSNYPSSGTQSSKNPLLPKLLLLMVFDTIESKLGHLYTSKYSFINKHSFIFT